MQTNYPKDPISINTLLQESSCASIIQKAQFLLKIEQVVLSFLPEDYTGHCRIMNLREETLVIEVDNSARATQLRYRQEKLIEKMQTHTELRSISQIQVLVRPTSSSKG